MNVNVFLFVIVIASKNNNTHCGIVIVEQLCLISSTPDCTLHSKARNWQPPLNPCGKSLKVNETFEGGIEMKYHTILTAQTCIDLIRNSSNFSPDNLNQFSLPYTTYF